MTLYNFAAEFRKCTAGNFVAIQRHDEPRFVAMQRRVPVQIPSAALPAKIGIRNLLIFRPDKRKKQTNLPSIFLRGNLCYVAKILIIHHD